MRAYEVSATFDAGETKKRVFTGSSADARSERRVMMDTFGVKMKDVVIRGVEIPTSKLPLLEFLNKLVA